MLLMENRLFRSVVAAFSTIMISLSVLAISSDFADAAVVSRIEVVGNERTDKDTVISHLAIKPGTPYNNADINSSVKQLFATGIFRDVSIFRRGSVLVVNVDENQIINEVFFKGNKRLKEKVLRSIIQSSSRSAYNREMVMSDVKAISNAYSRVGREGATVSHDIVELDNDRINVVFTISEGEKTKIANINFIGNKAFGSFRLKDIIQTKESSFFSFISNNDIYDPARIQSDEELLRRYYYNHGYADFKLISTVANLDSERNAYDVTFTLDEGEMYEFGKVTIESAVHGLSTEALYGELEVSEGSSYSARDVEKSIENLTYEISSNGFAFAEVVPRGDRHFQTHTIDVAFLIDEGPRTYVERIEIFGNDRTRDYVIRREFDIAEGDAFNRSKIRTAKNRLQALDFFEKVDVSTRQGSAPDRVVLVVRVIDKATGEFSIGGGYSSKDKLIGNIKFSEKNFLGRGQYFALSGGFGLSGSFGQGSGKGKGQREYHMAFTEPYFLGRRISAGVNISHAVSGTSSGRPYSQRSFSGSFALNMPIANHLSGGIFYRFGNSDLDVNRSSDKISAAIYQWTKEKNWISSAIGYSFAYSDLDSVIKPREGLRVTFKQEWAGLGGDANYLKTDVSLVNYMPLSSEFDVVALGRIRGGHIQALGGKNRYRILDNYFQGSSAVRGFDSYGFGPRDPLTDGDALGGMTYYNATAEVNFPLPFFPESIGLRGAVFADAGALFGIDSSSKALIRKAIEEAGKGNMNQVNDRSIRISIGASIIWNSPFGPIRFDYAEPVAKKPWDKVRKFNFGVSTSF